MNLITAARWIHVLAAAAWLGEVVTVVLVLVPVVSRLGDSERAAFISRVFPRVFRLATVLVVTTLVAGAWLSFLLTGWQDLHTYFTSGRGIAILLGGVLGLLLALFHFAVEARLEPRLHTLLESPDEATLRRVSRFLTLVPRIGLGVILAIVILMMIGARGV